MGLPEKCDAAILARQGARIVAWCRGINEVKQNDTRRHGDTVRFFLMSECNANSDGGAGRYVAGGMRGLGNERCPHQGPVQNPELGQTGKRRGPVRAIFLAGRSGVRCRCCGYLQPGEKGGTTVYTRSAESFVDVTTNASGTVLSYYAQQDDFVAKRRLAALATCL
jgi:hypothetical protein